MAFKRQAFNPGAKFIARKKLKVGDKVFNPGDDFPWDKLGFTERRLRALFNGLFIEMRERKPRKKVEE